MKPKLKVIHLLGAEFSRLGDRRKIGISACGMYKRNHFDRLTRDPNKVSCVPCRNTCRYRKISREEGEDEE